MVPEKILYTDGHEVTVTNSLFIVRKSLYQLKGITWHGLLTIHPARFLPFLVLLLGAALITLGILHRIPERFIHPLAFYSMEVSGNTLALWLGVAAIIAAAVMLILMKERYAIRIATAEGEKNVVVSKKKEYIDQILMALNQAFVGSYTDRLKHRYKT